MAHTVGNQRRWKVPLGNVRGRHNTPQYPAVRREVGRGFSVRDAQKRSDRLQEDPGSSPGTSAFVCASRPGLMFGLYLRAIGGYMMDIWYTVKE